MYYAKWNKSDRERQTRYDLICVFVVQSCLTFSDPMDLSRWGSSVHGYSPGKSTGVGCQFLLQGIFLTQESNPGLPHFRQTLYCLSHQGSPLSMLLIIIKTSPGSLMNVFSTSKAWTFILTHILSGEVSALGSILWEGPERSLITVVNLTLKH